MGGVSYKFSEHCEGKKNGICLLKNDVGKETGGTFQVLF